MYIKLCFCFHRKLTQISVLLLPVKQCRNAIRGSNGEMTAHTVVPFSLIYFRRQSQHQPHTFHIAGSFQVDTTHGTSHTGFVLPGGLQLTF